MQVAQIALPLFLARCRSMLQRHAAAISLNSETGRPGQLDDFMCMLEVLQLMNLPPAVADAAVTPGSSLQVMLSRPSLILEASVHAYSKLSHHHLSPAL